MTDAEPVGWQKYVKGETVLEFNRPIVMANRWQCRLIMSQEAADLEVDWFLVLPRLPVR